MGSIPGQGTQIPHAIVTKPMQQLEKPIWHSEDLTQHKPKQTNNSQRGGKKVMFLANSEVWVKFGCGGGDKSYMWIFDCRVCVCTCTSFVAQWCLTLCHPMDCSPPGSSLYGIFLARIPEWVVSTTSWRLPRAFATCLCRDWILCCCSCWPSTCPEGSSGWTMRHSVLQGNWRTGL